MIDRLIELIINAPKLDCIKGGRANGKTYQTVQNIADYLIKNGVIVSPCKVGDTVYVVGTITKQIVKAKVMYFGWHEEDMWLACTNRVAVSVREQLGKTVFLTKAEAEKALRGERE